VIFHTHQTLKNVFGEKYFSDFPETILRRKSFYIETNRALAGLDFFPGKGALHAWINWQHKRRWRGAVLEFCGARYFNNKPDLQGTKLHQIISIMGTESMHKRATWFFPKEQIISFQE